MKYFINYASNGFLQSQKEGLRTAKLFNFETFGYSEKNIDEDFLNKNSKILTSSRGGGYWLWKPYIILDMLNKLNDNDYLIYMDSGANLISDPSNYLDIIDEKGVLAFSMMQKTSKWTKGDCFYLLDKDLKFKDCNQLQGTYIFIRKTESSVNFVRKWLEHCTNENLISDLPNIYMDNLSDFIDHRHDQSIFSLLAYSQNIQNIPQIDQYCVEHGYDLNRKIINRHGIRF